MTTWGIGPFENESAAAFIEEVVQDGPIALQEAFEVVLDPDLAYVEAEEGQRAVAAAEIVTLAHHLDRSYSGPAVLKNWLTSLELSQLASLDELALQAIRRVLEPQSELPESWSTAQEARAWQAAMQELCTRLGG